MSEFTEEDAEYRKEGIKYAWDIGRAMNAYPKALVHRYVLDGGKPHLGIPPSRSYASGFPVEVDFQYREVIAQDIPNLGGLAVEDAVLATAFQFIFRANDEITLHNKLYRIVSNEYDRSVEVSRLILMPKLETDSEI